MRQRLAEQLPPPDVLNVDDDGFEWVASTDPAVRSECERNPIQMDDGLVERPRLVQLRPGYILEDVVGDSASSGPLGCPSDHYRRSMEVAQLRGYREAITLLTRLTSSPEGRGGDEQRVESASGPLTTWAAVARAVGVSADTMGRRRKEWKDTRPHPYYIDIAAARAWYRHGLAGEAGFPPPAPGRKSRSCTATSKLGTGGTTLADLVAEKAVATTAMRHAKLAPSGDRKAR